MSHGGKVAKTATDSLPMWNIWAVNPVEFDGIRICESVFNSDFNYGELATVERAQTRVLLTDINLKRVK